MYKILEDFTVKYKKDTTAVFTDETAEKIIKAGAFIEKIEEPAKNSEDDPNKSLNIQNQNGNENTNHDDPTKKNDLKKNDEK